ncbi:MAG: DUF448 domain-containing protein [Geobacteraceae bacterium]
MPKSGPDRTCLGCRAVKGKEELLRFVLAPDSTIVPDLQMKLPGRGAYTCINVACLHVAAIKKQFNRSFKLEIKGGAATDLVARVTVSMEERIAGYLSLAAKAGKVTAGSEPVMDALKHGVAGLVFVAMDISPNNREKIAYLAEKADTPHFALFDKERLGTLTGKGMRGAVAIVRGGFVASIEKELTRYRIFLEGGAHLNE